MAGLKKSTAFEPKPYFTFTLNPALVKWSHHLQPESNPSQKTDTPAAGTRTDWVTRAMAKTTINFACR